VSRSWEVVIDLVMKKTYHLCLSSDEVMFRDEEDYNRGFNAFALALYKTDSVGLVESIMRSWALSGCRIPNTSIVNTQGLVH
jgi:hypothetical protein